MDICLTVVTFLSCYRSFRFRKYQQDVPTKIINKKPVLHFRHPGLTQQREWQSKPDQLSASVFPSWLETVKQKWQQMILKRWQMGVRDKPCNLFRWAWISHESKVKPETILLTFVGLFFFPFSPYFPTQGWAPSPYGILQWTPPSHPLSMMALLNACWPCWKSRAQGPSWKLEPWMGKSEANMFVEDNDVFNG